MWMPLLTSIRANHPEFPLVLVNTITDTLLFRNPSSSLPELNGQGKGETSSRDHSFDRCLAVWAAWLVDEWSSDRFGEENEERSRPLTREDVVVALMTALGSNDSHEDDTLFRDRDGAQFLLDALCQGHPSLAAVKTSLSPVAQVRAQGSGDWDDETAEVMQNRLQLLLSLSNPAKPASGIVESETVSQTEGNEISHIPLPRGWTLVSEVAWKPCAFGTYCGS